MRCHLSLELVLHLYVLHQKAEARDYGLYNGLYILNMDFFLTQTQ